MQIILVIFMLVKAVIAFQSDRLKNYDLLWIGARGPAELIYFDVLSSVFNRLSALNIHHSVEFLLMSEKLILGDSLFYFGVRMAHQDP